MKNEDIINRLAELDIISTTQERENTKITNEQVEESLQEAWDNWAMDTGCIPCCFKIYGPRTTRVSANFKGSQFAANVASILNHRVG